MDRCATSNLLASKSRTIEDNARENFRHCVVIIDCFEFFCERPTKLKARPQTWSNYKQHNTVRFLIGISPQGVVSFVSRGWGVCVRSTCDREL